MSTSPRSGSTERTAANGTSRSLRASAARQPEGRTITASGHRSSSP
jgi:hypothetical protein